MTANLLRDTRKITALTLFDVQRLTGIAASVISVMVGKLKIKPRHAEVLREKLLYVCVRRAEELTKRSEELNADQK